MIIIIIILNITSILSQKCLDYILQDNQIVHMIYKQYLFIEKDDENYDDVEIRLNQDLIEKSFSIPLHQFGYVIQSKVIEPLNGLIRFQKWICNLMQSSNYFITYSSILNLNDKKNEQYSNQIVEIKSNSGEACEEFFGNTNNQFIVFCYTPKHINIYLISIQDNQTTLLQNLDISNLNITFCQRFYQDILNFQFIIAFLQCDNWNIIHIDGNSTQIILNQTIMNERQIDIEIKQLNDIQICVFRNMVTIFLIEENFYVRFHLNNNNIIQSKQFEKFKVKKLIIKQKCKNILEITESEIGQIYIFNKEWNINFNNSKEIHNVNNNLFYQDENSISYMITTQINYTIQIQNSQIYFLKSSIVQLIIIKYFQFFIYNYFYQIDQEFKSIQFYKYHQLNQYVKPTKQFLHMFLVEENQLSINFWQCYKIIKSTQDEERFCQIQTSIANQCQTEAIFKIQKYVKINTTNYEVQIPKSLEIKIHNQNNIDQFLKCSISLLKLNYTLLTYQNSSALFTKHDILRFSSCNTECRDQLFKLEGVYLFSCDATVILLKYGVKEIKVIQIQRNGCLSVQTQYLKFFPDKVVQFDKFLIVTSKDKSSIILEILSSINQFQFENEFLFDGDIDYIKRSSNILYIQQQNILITIQEQQQRFIKIEEIQVIHIIQFGEGAQVLGVHRFQNTLFHYFMNQIEIYYSTNVTFQDYQLIRPIVQQFNGNLLILAAYKQEQIYLIILELNNLHQIYWIKSIKTNSLYFFLKDDYLIYKDENDQLKQISISFLTIQVNNLNSTQSSLIEIKKYQVQLKSEFNNEIVECLLQINVDNLCNQLQTNQFYQKKLLNNLISPSHYFFGPIYELRINNNKNLKLIGPFINMKQLSECKSKSDNFCILKTKLPNKIQSYNIILANHLFLVSCQFPTSILNQDIYLFQISKQNLVYFWRDSISLNVYYQIFLYDNSSQQLKSEIIHKVDFDINNITKINVQKLGKLIILQTAEELKYFCFEANKLLLIYSQSILNNIINFSNDDNHFIKYSFVSIRQDIECQFEILRLDKTQFSLLGIMRFNNLQLYQILDPKIHQNLFQNLRIQFENSFILIKCEFQQDFIKVQIFQNINVNLILYDLYFNKSYQFESGNITKVIRNCLSFDKIIYIDDQTLIVVCQSKQLMYDLKPEKQFYDPIQKIETHEYQIYPFNI